MMRWSYLDLMNLPGELYPELVEWLSSDDAQRFRHV